MKTFLGDGVYLQYDGYHIILTTENGINVTNTIYLDPEVQYNLVKFLEDLVDGGKKED